MSNTASSASSPDSIPQTTVLPNGEGEALTEQMQTAAGETAPIATAPAFSPAATGEQVPAEDTNPATGEQVPAEDTNPATGEQAGEQAPQRDPFPPAAPQQTAGVFPTGAAAYTGEGSTPTEPARQIKVGLLIWGIIVTLIGVATFFAPIAAHADWSVVLVPIFGGLGVFMLFVAAVAAWKERRK
ncbi:MAG: hypothetical protein Q4P06_08600 [Actinomycetaceae bacterium]|nr:hypothetical protein [Actinomycetaceae bacterium]